MIFTIFKAENNCMLQGQVFVCNGKTLPCDANGRSMQTCFGRDGRLTLSWNSQRILVLLFHFYA